MTFLGGVWRIVHVHATNHSRTRADGSPVRALSTNAWYGDRVSLTAVVDEERGNRRQEGSEISLPFITHGRDDRPPLLAVAVSHKRTAYSENSLPEHLGSRGFHRSVVACRTMGTC